MGSGSSVENKGAVTFSSLHSDRWSNASAETGVSERQSLQSEEVVQYAEILHDGDDDNEVPNKQWKVNNGGIVIILIIPTVFLSFDYLKRVKLVFRAGRLICQTNDSSKEETADTGDSSKAYDQNAALFAYNLKNVESFHVENLPKTEADESTQSSALITINAGENKMVL